MKGIELKASEEHLSHGSALGRLVRREMSDRGRVSAEASQPRFCSRKGGEERDVRPRKGIISKLQRSISATALERLVRREMFDRGRVSMGFAPERKVRIAVGKRGERKWQTKRSWCQWRTGRTQERRAFEQAALCSGKATEGSYITFHSSFPSCTLNGYSIIYSHTVFSRCNNFTPQFTGESRSKTLICSLINRRIWISEQDQTSHDATYQFGELKVQNMIKRGRVSGPRLSGSWCQWRTGRTQKLRAFEGSSSPGIRLWQNGRGYLGRGINGEPDRPRSEEHSSK
ncbi:hypothetical protein H6P81_016462 [Aristolochia fimbriata]|uniref:Uncharacterized protein n=1 Tax=Aristolochia fimbriata TaxID=158543 RepID=A0AAV7EC65_ARIFI|nr:hypothetical protein H6P81_016462 [Aristolochia fimbriata]